MLMQNIQLSGRGLVKRPGFALLAIFVLALGIGANTAIFSVVHSVLLQPLAYAEPESLFRLWESNETKGWDQEVAAPANFYDWQEQSRSFSGMAAYADNGLTLTGGEQAEQVRGAFTTPNLFEVLGVAPALGRTFRTEENWDGSEPVAVISDGLFRRYFGGDPGKIGQKLTLDDRAYTLIGVMPEGFHPPSGETEVWVTHRWNRAEIREAEWARRGHFLTVIGRLKEGVGLERARTELAVIAERLEREYPATNAAMEAGLTPLRDWVVGDTRQPLQLLLGAVGFVLLIACTNVANLLLVRSIGRSREIAIRSALGADRGRLIRQLLSESVVLALCGGLVGVLLSIWGVRALMLLAPPNIPRLAEAEIGGWALAFGFGISVLAGLASGLVPALGLSRQSPGTLLKEGGRNASAGVSGQRARSFFVVAEVALAVVLVIAAGLLTRSLILLQKVDPGVDPKNLLTMQVSLSPVKYTGDARVRTYFEQLTSELRSLPGVEGVAGTSTLLLASAGWTSDLSVQGRAADEYGLQVRHKEVSPEYFPTMKIPVVRGRSFARSDDERSLRVAVINETLARRFFADANPVGMRIAFDRDPTAESVWYTVIGVARDEKQDGLGDEVQPEVYESLVQSPRPSRYLVIRTLSSPLGTVEAVRAKVRELDPDVPVANLRTMEEIVAESVSRPRFLTLMLTLLGCAALALASVGIFGVVSYTVSQRRQEIGVRRALGAQGAQVLRLVVGQGISLVLAGLAVGLVAALALTRSMRGLLFQVGILDPLTFAGVSVFLALVGLLACLLPAWRATKIDPMVTLRAE